MKLLFWSIGKAHDSYVAEGVGMFTKRISNYFPVEWQLLPPARLPASATPKAYKDKEGQQVLDALKPGDYLVLLDEKGKMLSSESFAAFIQARANDSTKQVVFLIGGAFGVSEDVKKRADFTWKLSDLVFPHQLVRLILSEQVYRGCSILRGEKYHHI